MTKPEENRTETAATQHGPTATAVISTTEEKRNMTGGTPVPLAEAEPEYNLRDIERLMRYHGKTLEEARRVLDDQRKKPKNQPSTQGWTPDPNPGPTPPFYGPCEPPLTKFTLYNFGPPPVYSLG